MGYIGLRLKLVCMVAGALALAITAAGLMLRHMFYQNLLDEKKTIADVITASLVHDIKYEYQTQERLLPEGIISKYLTYYRVIKHISIYDAQSTNMADSERKNVGVITQDSDIVSAVSIAKPTMKIVQFDAQNLAIRSIAPILQGSRIVAAVVLDISIQDIDISLSAIDRHIGLILIVTVAVASLAIVVMLRKSVLLRLRRLMNVTREIAAGNYGIRVDDIQVDEIGQLAQAFDQMTADLEKSKQSLEAYHAKNLEQKVQELHKAYKDLKNTQSQLVLNEKMASLGTLIAGIAHEINTPLGAISNVSRSVKKRVNLLPELLESLTHGGDPSDHLAMACLREVISSSMDINQFLSHKESQLVENFLRREGVDNWREVARALVNLNFYNSEKLEKYLICFRNPILFHLIEAIGSIAQAAKISETSCGKVQEIVRALKYYAYLDNDKIELIQVNDSIQTALVLLRNKLKYKVNVLTELDPDISPIPCTSEIHQVWTNLLSNAYDAIEELGENSPGQIVVSSRRVAEHIVVTVSDTGAGIPEDKLGNIFDPFFTTKDIGKGNGLGLSIVSGIVRRHNGIIRVQRLRNPTIFEVLLPLLGMSARQGEGELLDPPVSIAMTL